MKTKHFLMLITGICVFAWISAVVMNHLEAISQVDGEKLHHERSQMAPFPDDKARYIHWFLQCRSTGLPIISDIHISKFWDYQRVPDFWLFCTENIDVIRPEVVLATGDLTDAKFPDLMGSDQFPDEWHQYMQTLEESRVLKRTVWLDIKGNHDSFNVPSLNSPKNYFRDFSAQGRFHPASYHYVHNTTDGQTFSFVGVDATPNPGVKRPFNFFGMLSDESLKQLAEYGDKSRSSNMSIWFGHYPSSMLSDPGPFRKILSSARAAVYVSGHLHTLNGRMPKLYAQLELHGSGHLELEVGDWKDNRIYRLMAVDHDLFSFTDVKLGDWPIVLVTNPKDAQFLTPSNEPTGRMRYSTHIRILAFSPSPINEVKVTLDGVYVGLARLVQDSLYVLPWQPSDYATGLHEIEVHVTDDAGEAKSVRHSFTLDDSLLTFDLLRRLILLVEQAFVMKLLFVMTFLGLVGVLLSMKLYARKAIVAHSVTGHVVFRFFHCWFRRLYLLVQTPAVFWPLMAFHFYVALGPWFVGFLMDGYLGVMFVFGLFVKGVFVPAALTWVYGFIQLLMFNIPLTLHLARTLDIAVTNSCRVQVPRSRVAATWRHLKEQGVLYAILLLQAWFAYEGFYKAYGVLSLLLGPVRCWSLLLAVILQQLSLRMRSCHYRLKYTAPAANGASASVSDR